MSTLPPDGVVIRQGSKEDLTVVSSILSEAAEWLSSTGTPLWAPAEISPDAISPGVEAGKFYLAEVEGAPVATLRFQLDDPLCWPDAVDGDSA